MNELELLKEKTKLLVRFNPNHDSKGRFASSKGSSGGSGESNKNVSPTYHGKGYKGKEGRNYGKANTSDALEEIKGGRHNSLENDMDENGNLSEERLAIHKEIIDNYLKGKTPVEGQAEMVMMGGGPASGKSSAIKTGQVKLPDEKKSVTVDPDDIKKKLPGYNEMAEKDNNAASYYHEESSMIAKQLANVSFDENYNVVYDGTGDGSVNSVQKKIAGAKGKGYKVKAVYVTVDSDEAVRRNQKRYDDAVAKGEAPRKVPEEQVREIHKKVSDISMKTSDQFDSIELFDNNVPEGSKPVLIAKGGSGKKLAAIAGQEDKFKKYVDKAL